LRLGFTDLLKNKFMTPTASRTHGNVAELQSNPSLTKTSEGLSAEFSFPGNGAAVPTWKTILDFTCILLSMPLWLPVVLILALWIKLASPGPVFFRQERVGQGGKRFMILKFRTMKVNVETRSHERHLEQLINADVPMTKLDAAGDPRIIPGGRILRATGLDELPQLFNVLRGEMSLVGPRPCTPHEFKRMFEKSCQIKTHDRGARVRPQLFGSWNGET
jgi:lipopolysaccharide/colanic/teichoic acid biosynthesis glycosyltransferase